MSVRFSVAAVKKMLSPGKPINRKGWFGSKARNHVAFTLHCEEKGKSRSR